MANVIFCFGNRCGFDGKRTSRLNELIVCNLPQIEDNTRDVSSSDASRDVPSVVDYVIEKGILAIFVSSGPKPTNTPQSPIIKLYIYIYFLT